MEKKEIEIRSINIRSVDNSGESGETQTQSRTITGTAIVFDVLSEVVGINYKDAKPIKEIIDRGSVTQELINNSDIKLLYNHDNMQVVLARSNKGKGTLSITITDSGVDYSFEAKENSTGQVILDAVRSGDVDKCSFAFWVNESDIITTFENGCYIQRVMKISELYDFSIVSNPAYTQTSVFARSINTKEQEIKSINTERINQEMQEYYKQLRDNFL